MEQTNLLSKNVFCFFKNWLKLKIDSPKNKDYLLLYNSWTSIAQELETDHGLF